MTTVASFQSVRRNQQYEVESLLGELDERRRELYRLKAGGARSAGLRDQKSDYRAVQQRLSDVLGAAA
jgi:uncharacterized membrane-anchored protein YhcB (DUF1043 family)